MSEAGISDEEFFKTLVSDTKAMSIVVSGDSTRASHSRQLNLAHRMASSLP
jgi:hypothetical protein